MHDAFVHKKYHDNYYDNHDPIKYAQHTTIHHKLQHPSLTNTTLAQQPHPDYLPTYHTTSTMPHTTSMVTSHNDML